MGQNVQRLPIWLFAYMVSLKKACHPITGGILIALLITDKHKDWQCFCLRVFFFILCFQLLPLPLTSPKKLGLPCAPWCTSQVTTQFCTVEVVHNIGSTYPNTQTNGLRSIISLLDKDISRSYQYCQESFWVWDRKSQANLIMLPRNGLSLLLVFALVQVSNRKVLSSISQSSKII